MFGVLRSEGEKLTDKKRILVVYDDKAICESLKQILEMEGYNIDIVETGLQALDNLWSRHYHLVIIDSRLPDISGEKLQARINKIWSHIKIILIGIEPIFPEKLLKTIRNKLNS
jgi:DNA-binding NtrC family response regulator